MKIEIQTIVMNEKPNRAWRVRVNFPADGDFGEQTFYIQPDYLEDQYEATTISGSEEQCMKMADFMGTMIERALKRVAKDDVEIVRLETE